MDFDTWLLFCFAELLLCLSPGPAVFYVISHAVSSGAKASQSAIAGIAVGSAIYFALSAVGLGTLLATSHVFFTFVKWLGAAYLIWVGLQLFIDSSAESSIEKNCRLSGTKIFKGGMLIELSNPKTLIFFVAILPQFIDTSKPFMTQMLILGMSSIVIEWLCLACYGRLSVNIKARASSRTLSKILDKLSGSLLILIGLSLTFIDKERSVT